MQPKIRGHRIRAKHARKLEAALLVKAAQRREHRLWVFVFFFVARAVFGHRGMYGKHELGARIIVRIVARDQAIKPRLPAERRLVKKLPTPRTKPERFVIGQKTNQAREVIELPFFERATDDDVGAVIAENDAQAQRLRGVFFFSNRGNQRRVLAFRGDEELGQRDRSWNKARVAGKDLRRDFACRAQRFECGKEVELTAQVRIGQCKIPSLTRAQAGKGGGHFVIITHREAGFTESSFLPMMKRRMRLFLDVFDKLGTGQALWAHWPWQRSEIEGDTLWQTPDVSLQLGPLRTVAGDPAELLRELLAFEIEAGGKVVLLEDETGESAVGWPLRLCHAAVMLKNVTIEHRLCAFYRFFEYGAVAILRVRGELFFSLQKDALRELLRTGRPDWASGAITGLHELFR